MENNPLIILAGGNSIPKKEILSYNLDNFFVFGLNDWCRFPIDFTALLWLDVDFYWNNKKYIESKKAIKITKVPNNGKNPIEIIKPNIIQHTYINKKDNTTRVIEHFFVGIFALTLGIMLGFRTIYLLGYDCCEINGKTHFHDYNTSTKQHHLNTYKIGLKYFNTFFKTLPKDIIIYNVSPKSAITVFPKLTYAGFLNKLKETKKINQQEARGWLRNAVKSL